MPHSVGDVIRNLVTGEAGRIVRLANLSDVLPGDGPQRESVFIVSIAVLSGPPKEAMWFRQEVNGEESVPLKKRAASAPLICWICGKHTVRTDRTTDSLGWPVHIACDQADFVPANVGPPFDLDNGQK